MAFTAELERFGDRVTFWPEDERGLIELQALLAVPQAQTAIYCCGPEPLIAAVEQSSARWTSGSLHVERFRPRPGAIDVQDTDAPFQVVCELSDVTVEVGVGQTILEAVEAAGVYVPTSCREGTCGTCETVVLEGDVDHRDSFLTDAEREEGDTLMICCSRARGDRLVVEL
jgi:ferredoxin